jgi:hypothetical protein
VYTLKNNKFTEELHLFEATMNKDNKKCTPKNESLCGAMNKKDSVGNSFACYSEDKARKECAEIGRAVCANCVKQFYTTYD